MYFDCIKHCIEEAGYKDAEKHIFYLFYPNCKGETPFDIAMRERAVKCVDIMLDMMSYKSNYNFSKYIKKHFRELLEIGSNSFLAFLNTCTFEIKQYVKV